MIPLRFTLLAAGSSDRILPRPLRWLLINNGVARPIEGSLAELWRLPEPPGALEDRIQRALDLHPCDLRFIHRDAERDSRESRMAEIREATRRVPPHASSHKPSVCVVPVRMTEAWFLFDEPAMRRAAGNPNGTTPLPLPPIGKIESLPNPKETLHEILRSATGKSPSRLRKFSPGEACHRLADLIDDFSPLRSLAAFSALERDLGDLLRAHGWAGPA